MPPPRRPKQLVTIGEIVRVVSVSAQEAFNAAMESAFGQINEVDDLVGADVWMLDKVQGNEQTSAADDDVDSF